MTTTTKFCTVAQVKAAMNTADGWTEDDDTAAMQIEAATALIRAYTRREWEYGNYVDYFDSPDIDVAIRQGRGYVNFTLREKPVSVEDGFYPTIKYNSGGKWDDSAALDRTMYAVDTRLSRLTIYPEKMTSTGRSIRVSYYAGYPVDDTDPLLLLVGANLRNACIRQAAYLVRKELNATLGSSREGSASRAPGEKVAANGLLMDVLTLIKPETRLLTGNA